MKLTTKELLEAFVNKKNELGETVFSETKMSDAHIQKIIGIVAKKLGIKPAEIEADINAKIAKFDKIAQKAPILYATIQKNIVESEVFHIFEDHELDIKTAPKFDKDVFMNLVDYIKVEHDSFFPLRNFITHKNLHNPNIIYVPSPYARHKQFNNIDTAAATPKGDFIFNVKFMQKLLDFAHIKGLKPKGKKYEANGGEIPNEYAYIEFLIIHELMHYTYADFHYQKVLKASPKIINWVGDFRTNYLLVKSGLEQIPIGLFNDHINYDRQKTYEEMYKLVKEEFKKLSDQEKKDVEDNLDDHADDHSQGGDSDEGDDGEDDGDEDGDGDESWEPAEGEAVRMPNGKPGKITKIHDDGKIDVEEITQEEADAIAKGDK